MITVSCSTHNRAYMEQVRAALMSGLGSLTNSYCSTAVDCTNCPFKTACGDLNRSISFLDSRLNPCNPEDFDS